MTEEIRPICLYVETCLDRKEGKRDCAKCEHHLNYWTEVMIRDMEKNIKRLEQKNKELKDYKIEHKYSNAEYRQERESVIQLSYYRNKYRSLLEEIKEIAMGIMDEDIDEGSAYYDANQIINKINECIGE